MILTCNECEWSFKIDSALIKEAGSNVRCSKCGNIWRAYPAELEDEELVFETAEQARDQSNDDSMLNEVFEPATLEEIELDTQEDAASEVTELPELKLDPDFEKEEDDDDLPDLEGLLDFDKELLTDSSVPEEVNRPEALSLKTDERDPIDLSDLKELVENDSDSPVRSTEAVEPAEHQFETDKSLADNDSELEIFLGPDGELEETGDNGISDIPQSDIQTNTPTDTLEPDAGGFDTEDFPCTDDPDDQTHVIETDHPAPPTGQIGSGRRVFALLSIFLVFLGILIASFVFGRNMLLPDGLNFRIPFISDLFNDQDMDPAGNIRIIPLEPSVAGRFIQNQKAGELFVITGQVRNDYDHPRGNIRVTATLITKRNIQVQTATVYCGSIFSDRELSALDIATINRRLRGSSGSSKSNLTAGTGVLIPFMIVFHELPDNLDEYSVQVLESSRISAPNHIFRGKIEEDSKGT
jgi:predicted Zn finger-like uncharacterized protein